MLKITNLYKAYGKHSVLNDLTFTINSGEVYGLLGSNGAGKTTAINLICALLKATSGKIKINQQSPSKLTQSWIGVAPQENLLYQTLTCQENLNFYGKIYGLKHQKRQERIRECLAAVNLLERANSPVEILSGGMQRRMNIAIALVHHPKLLILDEPTTGLDIEARYEIWELIQQLKKQGMTILLTTHLLDEAQRLCQRVGILKNGKLAAEGTLDELRKLIPAQEIVILQTPDEKTAILRGQEFGFSHRYYGGNLAFWLPKGLDLKQILACFEGLPIDSISRQSVQLEHIYLEVTQNLVLSSS